jgi:hypothetical protein
VTVQNLLNNIIVVDDTNIVSGTSTGTVNAAFGPFKKLRISAQAGTVTGSLVASNSYSGSVIITLTATN